MAQGTSGTSTKGGDYGGSSYSATGYSLPSASSLPGSYSFAPSYGLNGAGNKDFLTGLGIGLGYAMGTMQGEYGKKSAKTLISYFSTPVYGVDNTKQEMYGMPGATPHNCPNCGFDIKKKNAGQGKNIESLIQGVYSNQGASNKKYAA